MLIRFVYLLFPFFAVAVAVGAMPDGWSRVQLMPREEDSWGACGSRLQKGADADLKAVAETQSFAQWKVFEDEHVKFRYPDHPAIKLEIKSPKDHIPISGGAVGTTDYSFSKSYRLAVGEHTYGLLMLSDRNEFDDGFCLCGAVAFQKYLFRNGALFRFDFLYDGNVKKIQMLSDGVRAVLFEWTHMPMTQEVYAELALSVELKSAKLDEAVARKMVFEKYGVAGRLGFLKKGMSRQEVVALFGRPVRSSETELVFEQIEARWRDTYTIAFQDGLFRGFQEDWRVEDQIPAERGTIDWIVETIKDADPVFSENGVAEKTIDPETAKYIYDRCVAIGPKLDGKDWSWLCQQINTLDELGYSDKRILPLIRKRFLERGVDQHHAAHLLHKNDPENSQNLFAARIRFSLDESQKIAAEDPEGRVLGGPYGDLHNLYWFLDKSDPRRKAFILEATEHPQAYVRSRGYFMLREVPPEEALPFLRRGLGESKVNSREYVSRWFAKYAGTRADLLLLRGHLEKEKNEEVRENLETAIKRLEALPAN